MVITYLKADEMVVSIIEGFPHVWEDSNQLLIEDGERPLLNDLTKAGWSYYKDERVERQYDENGDELPLYLSDLMLDPVTADDLPKSEHIGKLTAVDVSKIKLATVTRRWYGVNYDVQCLATQSVKELYQSGDIQIGDFVLVSFIEEIPNETERNIAIVTDKVYQSW